MMTQEQFNQAVESFIEITPGMTATRFGRAAMKDPTFVFKLRKGKGVRLETVEKVMRFIREEPAQ